MIEIDLKIQIDFYKHVTSIIKVYTVQSDIYQTFPVVALRGPVWTIEHARQH